MALPTGVRLGAYEILAAIGAGGMGDVYRALDSRLGRDVAIKVLPEAFARDAERIVRFQREVKLLASLNHQSIAPLSTELKGSPGVRASHRICLDAFEGFCDSYSCAFKRCFTIGFAILSNTR